eukprot:TRINITY_DN7719_c0_g1_i4.p1 TRINITY_DN7719_c0_g1~~TRINITY_DN7719_c0_g1_i4.p1  ORF type:complete len:135 (+),score=6.62 TRINITY_DN7719_c0_g1_i4:474-878(+)
MARVIYYSVASETLGTFGCTLHDPSSGGWFLNSWPWVSCSPSGTEYSLLLGISIPTFILFVVGLPYLIYRIVMQNQMSDSAQNDAEASTQFQTRFGFLYMPYKQVGFSFTDMSHANYYPVSFMSHDKVLPSTFP